MDNKKPLSIALFAILATSSFTFLGAFTFISLPQAEAQGLQLRVSVAENPAFENHFFGAQIVQIIIDDPGATDPDESTVGLIILGNTAARVHLSDGLWYSYMAEDQGFGILMDVLTDGARDNSISISKALNDLGSPVNIGGTAYTIVTGINDSFVAEFEAGTGGLTHAELNQADIFTILPAPFFQNSATEATSTVVNPDLTIGLEDEDANGNNTCTSAVAPVPFADPAGANLSVGAGPLQGDPDCDWPFVRLVGLEELDTAEIRAGTASVILTFNDLAESISSKLDRTTDYPLNAEIIIQYTDFMYNLNPVEEDGAFFVLDKATGDPFRIINNIVPGLDPDGVGGTGPNFPDIFPIFTSSPGLEFDERQLLEIDAPEGINSLRFIHAWDETNNVLVTFTQGAPNISENARSVAQFDDPDGIGGNNFVDLTPGVFLQGGIEVTPTNINPNTGLAFLPIADGNLSPVMRMFETDPNTGVMISTVEPQGGRSTIFAGVNDRVVSFDFFDIVNSAPMTTHDGFTSVDREVYDSADRAVFTVTDPDQNLRSRISEEPNGRESNSFLRVGSPFPLINTRNTVASISNVNLNTVTRVWVATFTQAGTGTAAVCVCVPANDATTFGIDAGEGANIFADVDNDAIIDIDTVTATLGTERFHADGTAGGPNIALATLPVDANGLSTNRRAAVVFTPPPIGGDPTSAIIIDSTLTVNDIDDVITLTGVSGAEILGQVRVDNLGDGFIGAGIGDGLTGVIGRQVENFLVQVAEIDNNGAAAGGILGQDQITGILPGTLYDVRMPRYNLVNVDLTDLVTTLPFAKAVVKIDAVDPICIPAATPTVAAAFDNTPNSCVDASQVVDFQLIETAVEVAEAATRDTDAVATTGDVSNVAIPAAGGAINFNRWDALIAADNLETGFDRDPLAGKAGVGAWRPLDLARVADLNDNGLADNSASTDRIRVTILLLAGTGLAPTFLVDEPISTIASGLQTVVVDFDGLGTVFDPAPTDATPDDIDSPIGDAFSNMIYRLELDEEGSNSSIFTGRTDFLTFTQFDSVPEILNEITLTGDPLRMWMPNRFIPPNRLAFVNIDEDIVQFFREVSATFIYETRDGSVEWDRSSFSFGQDAFLTITDEDLNRKPDATERYNLPLDSFVFFELGKQRVCSETNGAVSGDADPILGGIQACVLGTPNAFFNQIDATLLETGPNTGTFVSQITMPRQILVDATPGSPATFPVALNTQQEDLEANYIDIRDRSSVRQEFDDITNIRTTLGDVVLDRAAYPPGALMFIEIHDNDFNTDVDIRENIDLNQIVTADRITAGLLRTAVGANINEGTLFTQAAGAGGSQAGVNPFPLINALPFNGVASTANNGGLTGIAPAGQLAPILEINIFQTGAGRTVTLLPVGFMGPTAIAGVAAAPADNNRFGVGLSVTPGTFRILPMLDRNNQPVTTAVETGPNTGIFEFEVRMPGPPFNVEAFPVANLAPVLTTVGGVDDTFQSPPANKIDANLPIQVTYFDPADESGEAEDEEELATFLFNTARLRTDKLEYGLGEPVDIIVEEPDLNLDSRSIDEVSFSILDIITDKFDTEDQADNNFACVVNQGPRNVLDLCNAGNFARAAGLRTNLTVLRESGFNTGVFAVQIEELLETLVDRGEDVELIYQDRTPSGGGATIRIEYEFLVVEILPEIIFDKEEYTPFDEFIVSIISPDSNQDPDRIETINPLVSSSTASLGRESFPETGPNTGIFEEDFDLTPNPNQFPGDLRAVREDGVTVEFRIDEDTVATKSVFVNYHVGQVMFDKDAFRISERGVLRVIDPDANRNPDTIDNTDVRFWSTTDRGGLLVTLRETGDRTGIFEEIITFTPDEESTGTRLRVSEGDTITAKYTDNTLPAPAALAADEVFTVEVEELFASALIGAIVPPLERAVASEPELVDQTGAPLTDVSVGSQVLVQSEITNSQTKKQPFAYIVQIKDENGVTISLSWVTGELPAKESLKAAQSWIPDAAGDFTVEIFVWESVDKPVALSPVRTTTVSVK